jgi:hypothetical protein
LLQTSLQAPRLQPLFEAMRVFRNSGKKANWPDGFREAVAGFALEG